MVIGDSEVQDLYVLIGRNHYPNIKGVRGGSEYEETVSKSWPDE